MSDNDDNEPDGGFSGLAGMLRAMTMMQHDQVHMAADEKRMQVFRLLDHLTKDQLLGLRVILNLNESGTTWVDGMVVAQLRLQHKVDPDSGEDLLVT